MGTAQETNDPAKLDTSPQAPKNKGQPPREDMEINNPSSTSKDAGALPRESQLMEQQFLKRG